jgi:hypothetical protein
VSAHHCHAKECTEPCPPKHLMCAKHWRMVPQELQQQVWASYRPGQELDKRPSEAWMFAAKAAILAVFQREQEHRAKIRAGNVQLKMF